MTEARWSALYWLSRNREGLSQTALAERAGVESATLVRTLDQLESQGLVRRQPSLRDRRINVVRLTEAAEPIVSEVTALDDELSGQAMAGLDYEEYRVLTDLLRRIRTRIEALAAEDPVPESRAA